MENIFATDLYEKSNNDVVMELGRRFREYRIALRLTQKDISEQTGMSVMTIVRFERGEGSAIRLDNFIALLRAVQKLEMVSELIPDIPNSLYDAPATKYRANKRVRRRNNEK